MALELKLVKSVEYRIAPVDGLYGFFESDDAVDYQSADRLQTQFEELTRALQEGKILGSHTQLSPRAAMRAAKVILENYKVERR